MAPAELVGTLRRAGVAGCNLEDTDHAARRLRHPEQQAGWLRAVREAASAAGYGLVINARVDTFLAAILAGPNPETQSQLELVPEALERARAYLEAGADCVFPIALWQHDALAAFMAQAPGPVNILAHPQAPSLPELAKLGVARVSYASFLHRDAMEWFSRALEPLAAEASGRHRADQT
jgi:2-methylisocitrate lyase-like PEP mutase family enzyme